MTENPAPATDALRTAHAFEDTAQHLRLIQVSLADRSDHTNELVIETERLLHPSERLALQGNLFVVENTLTGAGRILIRTAPLPHARSVPCPIDLSVEPKPSGFAFTLHQAAEEPEGAAAWTVLDYEGGEANRIRTLHDWQRARRPVTPGHALPSFLTNTWGDRSRDSRITEAFIEKEIDAAARLHADIVQIDDGWQSGLSNNSATPGGAWEGFWARDPAFWSPHPQRFPRGLAPLVRHARRRKVRIGLWFAPDPAADMANWRRDADCLLGLFREHGIRDFKIDGIRAPTVPAQANLARFFDAVIRESQGQIVLDLDITAHMRPGYFGAMEIGPLFVENRYTDWHNYWPHQTLRNLWKLARWIDPRRLRMEFLNNSRNPDRYPKDPLAPGHYSPGALFAGVMVCNPLGWFEVSNLPPGYSERVAPLVATWRRHREALFAGTLIPIGTAPDGTAWTGFASVAANGATGYAVVFRELNATPAATLPLPFISDGAYRCRTLGGTGRCRIRHGRLTADIPTPLGYAFVRFERLARQKAP